MGKSAEIAAQKFADSDSLFFPTLMVIIACIAFGTVPFFVKSLTSAGIPSSAIPFYRYLLNAIILLPCLYLARQQFKSIIWALFSGLCLGVGWVSYVEALKHADVATAGVIYMMYPLFTLLIAWLLFKDKPKPRSIIAAMLVLLAALLTMSGEIYSAGNTRALLLSVIAPATFGLSIVVLVKKLTDLSPITRVAGIAVGAVIGLMPVVLPQGLENILPDTAHGWYLIIGIAVLTATIPQLIYSTYAPKIGADRAAIAGRTMFVVGWLAFGEIIGIMQYISAALIIIAIVILPGKKAQRRMAE